MKLESHSRYFKKQISEINQGERLPVVLVSNGAVIVDGDLVPYAKVDHQEIHWSRPVRGNPEVWEHGLLHTSADGTFVHGVISHGGHPKKTTHLAQEGAHPRVALANTTSLAQAPPDSTHPRVALANATNVVAASHSNDYQLQTTIPGPQGQGTFAKTTDAAAVIYPGGLQWGPFHKVEIGLSMTSKGVVQVTVTLPNLDKALNDPQDQFYVSTTGINSESFVLTVTITVVAGMEDILNDLLTASGAVGPPFYDVTFNVNLATNVVTGYYSELKHDPDNVSVPWGPGIYHPLYCPYSAKGMQARTRALAAVAASPHVEEIAGQPRALALRTNFHSSSANIHLDPSPVVMTTLAAMSTAADDDLPIGYLQTMTTPADADLHASSQTYMISAASYWRGSDEIKIFGDEKAGIEKSLPNSLKGQLGSDKQAFLRDHFGKHLLLFSLSRHKDYQGKFTDARKDKLQFWWTGKVSSC